MGGPTTCWNLVRDAARGEGAARDEFARRYEATVRAYLGARWRGSWWFHDLDDAVQDVFVECLKEGGVLERADPERRGGFRAFLYGVVRRIALRYESGRGKAREGRLSTEAERRVASDEDTLTRIFDEAYARSVMQEAARRQAALASQRGRDAERRVELLRLRFQDELPIRDIAARWGEDAAQVHRAYARARKEFREALLEVITFEGASDRTEAERRAAELLDLLD